MKNDQNLSKITLWIDVVVYTACPGFGRVPRYGLTKSLIIGDGFCSFDVPDDRGETVESDGKLVSRRERINKR